MKTAARLLKSDLGPPVNGRPRRAPQAAMSRAAVSERDALLLLASKMRGHEGHGTRRSCRVDAAAVAGVCGMIEVLEPGERP